MIPPMVTQKNNLCTPREQKAKKIQKHKQKDPQAPIEFDMDEDYDPIRPNDYEMYMEQQNRLKEEEERQRFQPPIRRRSPSISSDSSSSSRSRSISPPRYNSKINHTARAFFGVV
jgi:splicing factor 45